MRFNRRAAPDQTTRALSLRNRRYSLLELAIAGLFVGADAGAAGGGAAAPAAGGAAAAAAPAAGAAAAAPAAGDKGAPAAAPAAGAKADDKGAAAAGALGDDAVIGKVDDKGAPAQPKPATLDEQKKFLTERAGLKAEDVAKLSEADLKKQFDEAVAKEAAKATSIDTTKLKVPEGIEFKPEALKELADILGDVKLTAQERAQKLVDAHTNALKDAVEQTYDKWRDTQKKWQGEVQNDKELGGQNYKNTRAVISKAITQIMGKDADGVFEAFKFTGAGNNPAIVRLMTRIGNLLAEGSHVGGDAPGAAKTKSFASRVAAMYPSAAGSTSTAASAG